ncbi:hypothetical protein [Paracoccus sp. (in: a-proteobacteria)]|uniref:hypothetical protein n=1 Tax=Paracoccus sp. TaxID=267 RepID=UPI003A83C730
MRAALALFALLMPGFGLAQGAQSSLQAELLLQDPASGRTVRPDDGQPVRLQVRLRDPVTGQAPRGMDLRGWVRPVSDDNSSCSSAAQAFRATQRIPFGSVDLNGVLLVTLNRDASVGVVDPKLDLRSSNMIAASTLDSPPAAMAADQGRMRAFFSFPRRGRIAAMSLLDGKVQSFARAGTPADLAVFENGPLWAAVKGGVARFSPEGRLSEMIPLPGGAVHLRRQPDPESEVLGAFTDGGAVLMADGQTGAVLMRQDLGVALSDAVFVGRDSVLALPRDGDEALLRYADDPQTPHSIRLVPGFTRLAVGPDQRIAVAYAPGSGLAGLIDLALGKLVQPVELTDATISEVAFTDNAAFLLSHDGGFLGAVDLATVALGRSAVIRKINLGARNENPPADSSLLVPLFPSPQILAVEPANQTGWIVGELASTVEMPPMHTTRLRGGITRAVAVVDRSFSETAPGVFETVWAFPAGEQELVLTTGIGGLTSCIRFSVRGEIERSGRIPVALQAIPEAGRLIAGKPGRVAIRFQDDKGNAVRFARLDFLVPSMRSNWQTVVTAEAGEDGVLRADLTLPHPGPFVLQPLGLPPAIVPRSAVVIEASETGE